jgi:DNA-binding GntR family transcriptional regulator
MSAMSLARAAERSHQPLRNVVADEIRQLILDGSLRPGERLTEDRLAEQLGVSRNPVREAIRVLETEGLLEVFAHRGASVASLSAQHAENLFDVRLALEPLGARLAARSPSAEGIARMKQILLEVEEHPADHSRDALSDLHTELHSIVFEMTENPYLTAIALPMIKRGQWLLRQYSRLENPSAWAEHHALIAAIEEGDEDFAEVVARHHVLSIRRQLLGRFPDQAPDRAGAAEKAGGVQKAGGSGKAAGSETAGGSGQSRAVGARTSA